MKFVVRRCPTCLREVLEPETAWGSCSHCVRAIAEFAIRAALWAPKGETK